MTTIIRQIGLIITPYSLQIFKLLGLSGLHLGYLWYGVISASSLYIVNRLFNHNNSSLSLSLRFISAIFVSAFINTTSLGLLPLIANLLDDTCWAKFNNMIGSTEQVICYISHTSRPPIRRIFGGIPVHEIFVTTDRSLIKYLYPYADYSNRLNTLRWCEPNPDYAQTLFTLFNSFDPEIRKGIFKHHILNQATGTFVCLSQTEAVVWYRG